MAPDSMVWYGGELEEKGAVMLLYRDGHVLAESSYIYI